MKSLEGEKLSGANLVSQMSTKDELIEWHRGEAVTWKHKYEVLAKLYSQLRIEHLEVLSKVKHLQSKANGTQEAVDRMERMEREMKAKNAELADMIRERDRARFDLDRNVAKHKQESERLKSDIQSAHERLDSVSRSKGLEASALSSRYQQQLGELDASLDVSPSYFHEDSRSNSPRISNSKSRLL